MQIPKRLILAISLVIFGISPTTKSDAQSPGKRLKTMFTGDQKCLDIINDGENNKLIMADCGNYSGQFWKIQPTKTAGYSSLKTQFTGNNRCLDIINDGENDKLIMTDCGNYSGQFWSIK